MFREMRFSKRQLPTEQAEEILKSQTYGLLSVTGDDGYPYGVPLNYGYIDGNGKTVIGFQYDEARPFNKYGVAVVSKMTDSFFHLIDLEGNEIPGTRFPYISYYDYIF